MQDSQIGYRSPRFKQEPNVRCFADDDAKEESAADLPMFAQNVFLDSPVRRRRSRLKLKSSTTSPACSLSNSSPVPSVKSSKFDKHSKPKTPTVRARIRSSFSQLFHHQKENTPLSLRDLNHADCPVTPLVRRGRPRNRCLWRPALSMIYKDEQLLEALTAFMSRSFNSENILFLQSARRLNAKIEHLLTLSNNSNSANSSTPNSCSESQQNDVIDAEISALYHLYITSNAQRQINVSHSCYDSVVLWFGREWSTLPLNQKSTVFDECVIEIELLMKTSVIYLFYQSDEFEVLAQKLSQTNHRQCYR